MGDKNAHIVENIKLISNTTTRVTPFKAHFSRPPNTPLSNILTKPSSKNLNYEKVKLFYLDKKKLKKAMLSEAAIWNHEFDTEPQVDIQYRSPTSSDTDSNNQPLANKEPSTSLKRKQISPIRITPDKLSITFGDKTSVLVKTKNQVARKTILCRTKEPGGTLKPLWNIGPDGNITIYTTHTITIDTPARKDMVIRRSDIAILTETAPIVKTIETKPCLITFIACKTLGEYDRNREKIRKFYLCEQKAKEAKQQQK